MRGLDIFINEKFDGQKIIAPGSIGSCKFCIRNLTDEDISYNINFFEESEYVVNMKYKLKIDNVYIRGNQEEYVDVENLDVENIVVLKDSSNVYTLEWYWEDDDENDTIIGSQEIDQYYTLNLEINSTEYVKDR
jgi:hypothetical protein